MANKSTHSRTVDQLLSLAVILSVLGQGFSNCPQDWVGFYDENFELCFNFKYKGTFDESVKYCKQNGGKLATTVYKKAWETIEKDQPVSYWVGIEDKGKGDGLQLLDGSEIPTSVPWKDKKPAKSDSRMCGRYEDGQLTTKNCETKQTALCERKSAKCPKHWYPLAGDCIKLITQMKSWTDAYDFCENIGTQLLTVDSRKHADDLGSYLKSIPDTDDNQYWSGAKYLPDEKEYVWSHGDPVEENEDFKLVNLKEDSEDEHCGYIEAMLKGVQVSVTPACDVHKKFICLLEGDSSFPPKPLPQINPNVCSDGFKILGDSCYWESGDGKTWSEAKEECENRDAKLFIAKTKDMENYLFDIVNDGYFWVGLQRDKDSDPLKWLDGTKYSGDSIKASSTLSRPTDAGGCVMAAQGSTYVNLFPVICDLRVRFMCQKGQDSDAPWPVTTKAPTFDEGDCGAGWESRPNTDACYLFFDYKKQRQDAGTYCTERGGFLVSVNDKEEEEFLKERLSHMVETRFWIGLTKLSYTSWSWVDNSPLAYINWAGSQGTRSDSFLSKSTMQWYNAEAAGLYEAFICEKHVDDDKYSLYTSPNPIDGKFYECEADWYGFENKCYFISHSKKTWSEARQECLNHGADLASVQNLEENAFIQASLPNECKDSKLCEELTKDGQCSSEALRMSRLCPVTCGHCEKYCENLFVSTSICDDWASKGWCTRYADYMQRNCRFSCGCNLGLHIGYWIGFNSKEDASQYKWSDSSEILLTYWAINKANFNEGNNGKCVFMARHYGRWHDVKCDVKSSGFVCEKPKTFKDKKIEDPSATGCPVGSRGHGDLCYNFVTERKSWSDAKQACEDKKQTLVIVRNQKENAFLTAVHDEVFKKGPAWIGLSHGKDTPKWSDGEVRSYEAGFAHGEWENGKCASIEYYGSWGAVVCTEKYYFICESFREGYTKPPPTEKGPTTTLAPCPGGWTGFGGRCYKLFKETKTWSDALGDCESYGGTLAAVHGSKTNDLLHNNLHADQIVSSSAVWIGLRAEKGLVNVDQWTDGATTYYENWVVQPKHYSGCAAMLESGGWKILNCNIPRSYFCQISRGTLFQPHTTPFIAPVKYCDDDWREFEGNCYIISESKRSSWRAARRDCVSKGADLVSIHSKKENDFIAEMAKSGSYPEYWIGYYELGPTKYVWSDGSAKDFSKFRTRVPNDGNGKEKCVEINSNSGSWDDEQCSKKIGYICKKRDGTAPPPTLPSEVKGKCPSGFKSEAHSRKCFYFSGKDKRTWENANARCQWLNKKAKLATIQGPIDQAYVTLLIEEAKDDVWIGFKRMGGSEWRWLDNTKVGYTNWEPDGPDYYWGTSCASISQRITDPKNVGTWNSELCWVVKPFLCQVPREPGDDDDSDPFEDQYKTDKCDEGFFLYHDRCYKYFDEEKTWEEASTFCQKEEGSLAFIQDVYEGARLNYESYRDGEHKQFWIDVRFNKDLDQYVWGNNYEVEHTFWEAQEPDQAQEDSCVTSSNGYWFDESCSEKKTFFCVLGGYEDLKPTTPGPVDARCEYEGSVLNGDKCYWIPKSETASWDYAERACTGKGMDLASIHNKDENKFLRDLLKKTRGNQNAWIGLKKSGRQRQFSWSDSSPYNFKHWALREPSSSFSWGRGSEDCTEMMMDSDGEWNDYICDRTLAYICSGKATISADVTTVMDAADTTTKGTASTDGGSSGQTNNPVSSNCLPGWTIIDIDINDPSTYLKMCFKGLNEDTFDESKKYCESHGGTLTTKISDVVMDTIAQTMPGTYWVGLESKGSGQDLQLLDGSDIPSSAPWKDDKKPDTDSSRQCGILQDTWLTTVSCDQKHKALCQRKSANCPKHWYSMAGDCTKVFKDITSWDQANEACKDMNAQPLKITSQEHAYALLNYMSVQRIPDDSGFWSGAKYNPDTDEVVWSDGTPVEEFSNLKIVNLDKASKKEHCGFLYKTSSHIVLNLTTTCDVHENYACFLAGNSKVPKPPSTVNPNVCSDGFSVVGDSCYWMSKRWGRKWSDADDACKDKGARLFMAPTKEEENYLFDIVGRRYVWVGMSRSSDKDPFKWLDNKPYSGDAIAEPTIVHGVAVGNCALATQGTSYIKYHPIDCSVPAHYMCQKDQDPDALPLDVTKAPEMDQGDCGDGWESRPGTDTCYSFIDNDNLERYTAEIQCGFRGGHLVSINSKDEEDYLKERLTHFVESIFWTGIQQTSSKGWHWNDKSPFVHVNWAAGQPFDDKYAYVQYGFLNKQDMTWIIRANHQVQAAAICEKQVNKPVTPLFTTPKPKADKYYECDSDWLGYENKCYFISSMKKTWSEARQECLNKGADLASIQNTEENNFIWSSAQSKCEDVNSKCEEWKADGQCSTDAFRMSRVCPKTCGFCDPDCKNTADRGKCDYWASIGECERNPDYMWLNCILSCGCDRSLYSGFWIGLNEQRVEGLYEWSDSSEPQFTKWGPKEPNNYIGKREECVLLRNQHGQWSDEKCDRQSRGFVCQKSKTFKAEKIVDPASEGCPEGALGHWDMCYTFVKDKKSWADAKEDCKDRKQTLVTIVDEHENGFVTSEQFNQIGNEPAWIGLYHEEDTSLWTDGVHRSYEAEFAHGIWESGKCAVSEHYGFWGALDCTEEHMYICHTFRTGHSTYVPPIEHTATTPAPCSAGWTGYKDMCYKMFKNEQTWMAASMDCESYGGSLINIHDEKVNNLLKDTLNVDGTDVWIALKKAYTSENFEWTYGIPVYFEAWAKGQPIKVRSGTTYCVEMNGSGEWRVESCILRHPYVCEIFRGGLFQPHSTPFIAPVEHCDDDWRKFEGECYMTSGGVSLDWRSARRTCLMNNADLVSIHSQKENDFILQIVDDDYHSDFWIGYHELGLGSYAWSDGSARDFVNFASGEPNDANGGEKCVNLYSDKASKTGKWNDEHCSTKHGYICKRLKGTASPPTLPSEVVGKCPSGFKSESFSKKCFYFSGDDNKLSWHEAQKACQKKNSKAELAAIKGPIDQTFATLLIESSEEKYIWFGFSRLHEVNVWKWTDNSVTRFTHWAPGVPDNDDYYSKAYEKCGLIQRQPRDARDTGTWHHAMCSSPKPYLCQVPREPGDEIEEDAFENQFGAGKCTKHSFFYHDRCYKFHDDKKTWQEAHDFCQSIQADLALVMDTFEGARLNYASYNKGSGHTEFWIGVKFNEDLGEYVWGKDYEVQQTFFQHSEPDQPMDDSCVSFMDGYWYDESCSDKKPFFCAAGGYDDFIPPKLDIKDAKCEDPKTKPFGNKCYWIPVSGTATWPEANTICLGKGMTLASVHTKDENKFLADLLEKTRKDEKSAWIGLEEGYGSFRWSDGSPDNFFYWDKEEEILADGECVDIKFGKSGRWGAIDCFTKLAYVCSLQVASPPTTPAGDTSDSKSGKTTHLVIIDPPKPDESHKSHKDDDGKGGDDDGYGSDYLGDDFFGGDDGKGGDGDGGDGDDTGGDEIHPPEDHSGGSSGGETISDPSLKKKQNRDAPKGSGLSGGAIAGIFFAVLAICGLIIAAFVIVQRRRPLWRQESVLRGKNSPGNVAFDNVLYQQEQENSKNAREIETFGLSNA